MNEYGNNDNGNCNGFNSEYLNRQNVSEGGASEHTYNWSDPRVQQGAEQPQQGAAEQVQRGAEQVRQGAEQPQQGAAEQVRRGAEQIQQGAAQAWRGTWQTRQGQGYAQYNAWQTQRAAGTKTQGTTTQQTRWDGNNWQAKASARNTRAGKRKARRGWGTVVAMALVFGLIAGAVTYGVNLVANRIHPASVSDADSVQTTPVLQVGTAETENTNNSSTAISGSAADGLSVAEVASNVMPSMVTISTMTVQEMQSFFGGQQKYEVPGAGTGFIISQTDEELLIATNNHVVSGATQVSVGFVDESAVEASIKGQDPTTDVAVVAVKRSSISEETAGKIKVATLGDSDELVLGEQVVAIGNALGYGQSVTSGYISGFDRELKLTDGKTTFTATDLIQTDAAINSGNSGGALVNMRGEVIGINEAKSSMTSSGATVDNVGYVIPMAKAMPILQDLMSQETKEILPEEDQGYLGVTCADVTSDYAQMYDMPQGVCFTSVIENGPASLAGAKKGDVLVKFDGQDITDFNSLTNKMRYYAAEETVEIVVLRANEGEYKEVTLTVKLGTQAVIQGVSTPEDDG